MNDRTMLSPQEINEIVVIMERATIQGKECARFMALMQKLQTMHTEAVEAMALSNFSLPSSK
jgi:hypothetical protein